MTATEMLEITPYDHTELGVLDDSNNVPLWNSRYPKAFTLATAGTLHVTHTGGSEFTYNDGDLLVGVPIPGRIQKLWDTGTSATRVLLHY